MSNSVRGQARTLFSHSIAIDQDGSKSRHCSNYCSKSRWEWGRAIAFWRYVAYFKILVLHAHSSKACAYSPRRGVTAGPAARVNVANFNGPWWTAKDFRYQATSEGDSDWHGMCELGCFGNRRHNSHPCTHCHADHPPIVCPVLVYVLNL
jgi:hypothetical protein